MKKAFTFLTVVFLAGALSGCTTYEERTIDEGTVIEERMIVE